MFAVASSKLAAAVTTVCVLVVVLWVVLTQRTSSDDAAEAVRAILLKAHHQAFLTERPVSVRPLPDEDGQARRLVIGNEEHQLPRGVTVQGLAVTFLAGGGGADRDSVFTVSTDFGRCEVVIFAGSGAVKVRRVSR